ncbi:hypothetical protein ACWC4C_33185 [Streptomyces olivaceoviridis]
MADQQLDTVGGADDEDGKLWEALCSFKETVRGLVEKTGLTTNQLADAYHFGKGKVSTWQTAKPEQPNIPPLRFIEVLIKEAKERANLQDRAAEAFLHQYGELLKLYCARENPHNVHRQMLLDYQNTLAIRELNDATNAALERIAELTAALETLREDRDGERRRRVDLQRQIDSLTNRNQDRSAARKTALAQRDRMRADLSAYESDQQLEKWEPGSELGGSYTYRLQEPSVPLAPPPGRDRRRRGLVLSLLGVLVLSLAVYAGTQLPGNHNNPKNTADNQMEQTPTPAPPTTGSDSQSRPSSPAASTSPETLPAEGSPTSPPEPGHDADPSTPAPTPTPRLTAPAVSVRWQGTLLLYSNGAPSGWWLDDRPPSRALVGDLGLECDCHPGEVDGNALAAWHGAARPTYQQCSEMSGQLTRRALPVQEGSMACLKTLDGRLGYFTVTSIMGPAELNLEATVWDRQ